ncbi:Interdomain Rrm packing contributes To Rna recognition in the Rna15, Hrp1, anchor Rna 3, partial [Metschnikowia bicuspidata var. bicuspidata NRRL YB-4993]
RDSGKMFIGGLNWDTTEDGMVAYFSKYGEILDYTIMKDSNTGRSRGFGFLTFKDPRAVDEVIKKDHILDGKLIDPKRAIAREEQDKIGKIFVGGIDPLVNEKDFNDFFSQFGRIIDAQLMIDKDTGRSRGFGFITYDSPEAVDKVCLNKYLTLKGKAMEVKRAEPR